MLLNFRNINSYIISEVRNVNVRKYFNQNTFVNNKNSKIPIVRNVVMNSNKNDQTTASINMNRINDYQWDLLTNYQLGLWKGIQTGYDPLNDDVADYMYTEVDLNYLSNDKKEIKHINSMVAGEIRADCEVCFDSERLKSKEIGIYTKGKLKSRLCYNSELRGILPHNIVLNIIECCCVIYLYMYVYAMKRKSIYNMLVKTTMLYYLLT